jgi:hypothetical protein
MYIVHLNVLRWRSNVCVVTAEKTMHTSLRNEKRQVNAFLFPTESLFSALLSFENELLIVVSIVGALRTREMN